MSTVATLDTVMRLNSTAFRQGMVEAAAQANKSLGSIQKQASETASVLLQLKRAAGAAGSLYLVKEGFDSLVESQKQLQAISYTFQAATGSASKAADALSYVRKEAADIGLVLPDSAEGFAKLSASATAAGVAMKDQTALFDAYAKASTTLHLSTTQSNRALLALEQMFAKGKIQAQELRLQLGQAVPGAAARFQNAVMQMTKGTDLAGKSFDQLLEAGALTTSKFLPALVTALQQSGQGWEQASHGLQAELNRVQTAWFNLKSEVSGGLFDDAITGGARLLADNLSLVANAITTIGAGSLARVLGGGLSTGASKVERLAQEYRGTRQAATAEREYAQAQMASAEAAVVDDKAQQSKIASTRQSVVSARAATQAAIEKARADQLAALAQKESAAAFAAKHAGNASAIVQEAVSDRQIAAQNELTAATVRYEAARAGANALSETANAQNSLLIKSNLALTASEDALAAAQARVAETRAAEAAVGGLGAAVGRAAKSFGAFALSLVGGPWGLAVAAIGGIAYAVYSVQKASEEYRAETAEQAKSLRQLTAEVDAAAASYGKLHDAQNLSKGIDAFTGSDAQLRKSRNELASLRDEADKLQEALASRAANPNAGTAILDYFDQRKLDEIRERMAALEPEVRTAQQSVSDFKGELGFGLTPALEGAKAAIDRLRAGGSLRSVWEGLTDGFDAGVAALNTAKAKVEELSTDFNSRVKSATKDLETRGKSQYEIGLKIQQNQIEQIHAQTNLTKAQQDQQIAALRSEQAAGLLVLKQDDSARAAKGAAKAITAEAEAYKNFAASQQGQIETLQAQVDGAAKGSAAQRALNTMLAGGTAEFRKLTPAHKAEVLASQQHIVTLTDEVTKLQLAAAATKQLADLDRQLAEQRAQQDRENARSLEGMSHGSVWNQQRAGIESIQDAYRKQREEADKAYQSGVSQATATGNLSVVQGQLDETHAQALGKITLAEQAAILAQRQFYSEQATLQSDWTVGAKSAFEDYINAAENAAATSKDFFTASFGHMEDSLFELATTGKTSFGSLTTSILKDLARMELRVVESQILQGILGAFAGSYGATGNTTSSLGTDSTGGSINFVSHVGGRATGGPVNPGKMYEVAEGNRPELLTSGGRTYLMMGQGGGNVTPAGRGASSGGAGLGDVYVTVQVTQNGDGTTSSKTDVHAMSSFGKQMGEQMKAVAEQVVQRGLLPNGQIDKAMRQRATA